MYSVHVYDQFSILASNALLVVHTNKIYLILIYNIMCTTRSVLDPTYINGMERSTRRGPLYNSVVNGRREQDLPIRPIGIEKHTINNQAMLKLQLGCR